MKATEEQNAQKNRGKTLYVSDLDGTLLSRRDRLSPYTVETLNRLLHAGVLFTYATARSLSSASVVTEGLRMDLPVIVYNGAFIQSAVTGKVISSQGFSAEERAWIFGLLEDNEIYPFTYKFLEGRERVHWMRECENEGALWYLGKRIGDPRMQRVASLEELRSGEVFYFTCIGEREELLPVYERRGEFPFARFTLQQELYRPEYWLEIMPRLATKAEAAERLKEWCGCKRLICFGDRINDIPMFLVSDEAYAVQEAAEELKAVATGVLGSNEEDAVAEFLWKKGFGNQ